MKLKKTPLCSRQNPLVFLTIFLIFFSSFSIASATSVTLRWDAVSPTPDSYRVYARKAGQAYNYNSYAWSGTGVTCSIGNLDSQTNYYFVVRTRDNGLESADSNEVYLAASASPTSGTDSVPPSWNGATKGIGSVKDNRTGGSVTVEFDTAKDAVNGSNLKFNVYYAASTSWKSGDWSANNVVTDATTKGGGTFANAVTLSGLTNNVKYAFGVRAEDQSGNEDTNTTTLTATPTVAQTSTGAYNLMLSTSSNRSGAVYLDDAELAGNIYVFVTPTTGIQKVEFYIDGTLKRTEGYAPYDLAGGTTSQASPFNANNLSSGYHTFSARITKTDGSSETISAEAHLYDGSGSSGSDPDSGSDSAYSQMVSTAANRSNAIALDGASLSDQVYVFVTPTTGIQKVEFYVDGTLKRTEGYAPYDLAGGTASQASPFNTNSLSSGYHTFSARITKTDGSRETISAEALIGDGGSSGSNPDSGSDSGYTQMVSTAANRSNPDAMDGASVTGKIYVFVTPTTGIQKVEFYVDGTLKQTEGYAPYDLAGGTTSQALPYNTANLSDGYHTFSARITQTSGTSETTSARVYVNN